MTLRRFIDAGYATLIEEYQRLGIDLLTAIEKVSGLGVEQTAPLGAPVKHDPNVPDPRENERAMAMLTGMMAGVKGAPV